MLAACHCLQAQKIQPDKLREIWATLRKPIADTARVKLYVKLAESHSYDPFPELDSALYYCNRGRKLSQSINFQWGWASSDATASDVYRMKGDRERGYEAMVRAIDRCQKYDLTVILIEAYLTIGYYWRDEFNDKDYLELALQTSIVGGNTLEEQRALIFMASRDAFLGNYRQAIGRRLRALELSKKFGHIYFDAEQYGALGYHYALIGNYEEAIKYGLEAVRISEESSDSVGIHLRANRYNSLANTYYSMKQYEKALVYYQKAVDVGHHYREYLVLFTSMITNVSTSLVMLKRYDQALENLNTMVDRYPPVTERDTITYDMSYMSIYIALDKIRAAIPHVQRIERYYKKNDGNAILVGISLIRYCIAAGRYAEAQQYLNRTRGLYKAQNRALDFSTSFELQFKLDSARGNYLDAIRHYQRYKAIGDSLANKQRSHQIGELEVIYETQKKDQNIRSLTQQAQLQQALSERKDRDLKLREQDIALLGRERQLQAALAARKDQDLKLLIQKQALQEAVAAKKEQDIRLLSNEAGLKEQRLQTAMVVRNITFAGVILLMLVIALLYNRYQIKQRSSRSISAKNEALQKLVIEKEWLVKEVHHRVKNNLQTIVSLLESQSRYLNDEALHAILDSQNRVHAMSLIHQALYRRASDTSINLGNYLYDLVHHLRDSLNGHSIIHFRLDIAPIELDVSQAVPIGLIVNEAVTNSIKYAFRNTSNRRNEISIHAEQCADRNIVLVIADNGAGLPHDFDARGKSSGLGLKLIRGLAEDIEATLTLESDRGLKIRIAFVAGESLNPAWEEQRTEASVVSQLIF
jgi:two-component sensor histidine kinase